VSRVAGREGESFISPAVQRETIENYARLHKHEVVRWWTDLDQTGARLDRPEFQKMLARCQSGETGGIIAAKLDRLTRSLSGLAQLIEQADDGGWTLVAVDLGLDLKRPGGQLVANVLGAVAQWELAQRREGWDQAQARAVERGVHVASRTPTGYRRISDKDARLEPDPAASGVIRELFARRARGDGWTALAHFLDESGVRGPYGNGAWTPSAVSKMIRNRAYLGEARSGQHVNESAHAALVSRAEFEAAQGDRTVASARIGDGLLLQGVARCAGCRYLLKADNMKGRNGERLGLYRCRKIHAAGECPAPATIMARVLDPFIDQAFVDALGPTGPLAEAVASTKALDAAVTSLEDAEAELALYRDANLISVIGKDAYLEGLEARAEVVRVAQAKLNEARQQSAMNGHDVTTSGDLIKAWPTLTIAEKRALLTASLDAIFIRSNGGSNAPVADRTLLLWRGEGPADLPRRGHRVPLESFLWPDKTPMNIGVASGKDTKPRRRKRATR
jgi:site-specific DNA recombinase